MQFSCNFIFPCLLIIKLSGSSQDKKQSSSLFLLSGGSQQGTILPYFSFPWWWTYRLFQGFMTTHNTAGASLDMWSWVHVQVFLGENTKRLDGSPEGQLLRMRRTEAWKGHPGSLGQWREKKESGSADLPALSRPRATVACSLLQEGKDLHSSRSLWLTLSRCWSSGSMSLLLLFVFCFFDHTSQLVGSQFSNQGLNPGHGSESAES